MPLEPPARVRLREQALELLHAALAAVDPFTLVSRRLSRDGNDAVLRHSGTVWRWPLPLHVVGAGKAAAAMARGVETAVGNAAVDGLVVVPDGHRIALGSIEVVTAAHPVPDARSVAASQRVLDLTASCSDGSLCCLISGGASSLLALPAAGLSLDDKRTATRLLLRCGAAIDEFNTVRKHLSAIKGGGVLRAAQRPLFSLIISDVVGDAVATIGSAPTVPDPTTFADAWRVIEKYELTATLPPDVSAYLQSGLGGGRKETLKPGEKEAGPALVIGSNQLALSAARDAARAAGWEAFIVDTPISGNTHDAAVQFAARLLSCRSGVGKPICLLAGGETTVEVRGDGRGGRNQEFALAAAPTLAATPALVLSAGTDGIDGPTDAAGGFVDGTTLDRATALGLSIERALARNDSYPFLDALGDLVRTGPTGTNVMDIKIGLHLTP